MTGSSSGLGRGLLALGRMARVAAHLARGVWLVNCRFDGYTPAQRHADVQAWSQRLFEVVGLTVRVHGAPLPGPALVVANHVSWLDIAGVHVACPQARFVSKADVLRWPLIGTLTRGAGTLFIERERKRDALRVVHQMADALKAGDTVAIFPEGTTGPGPALLPFHANLLQAAISAGVPVQPVVLHYREPGQAFSESAQYIGETTLIQSIWRVVSARGLMLDVHYLAPQPPVIAERRALSDSLHAQIQQQLNPPA